MLKRQLIHLYRRTVRAYLYHCLSQYLRWSVPVDKITAKMLVAGIIADTIILKSPTTTPIDVAAVKALAKLPALTI